TMDRDGSCVITGQDCSGSQAAHIIPYSIGKSQARASTDLWAVLRMFWGDEEVGDIQSLVFGTPTDPPSDKTHTLINRLYNVITLSSQAHTYWGQGYFVLEPHPDNNPENQYEQQAVFYWVHPNGSSRVSPGIYTPILLTAKLPELSPTNENISLFFIDDTRQPQFVKDGHLITFRTDNPDSRPLPSMELLWLQCTLVRVLRMAGRAGWDALEMNYSDTDVDSVRVVSPGNSLILSEATVPVARSTPSGQYDIIPQPQITGSKALNNTLQSPRHSAKPTKRFRGFNALFHLPARIIGRATRKATVRPNTQIDGTAS
ncbi:hypothetical protein GP486_005746, partial [Trichoglossum hirsutum]